MMGSLEFDMSKVVTKTTAGLIVLPVNHQLIVRKRQPAKAQQRIGKSACDQCTFCTELCRAISWATTSSRTRSCAASDSRKRARHSGISMLRFAAHADCARSTPVRKPFSKEACDKGKVDMKEHGEKWEGKREVKPHAMYEGRRTPLKQLMKKTRRERLRSPFGIQREHHRATPRHAASRAAHRAPASALVKAGERVEEGMWRCDILGGKLGARIHASIGGIVRTIDTAIVIEQG